MGRDVTKLKGKGGGKFKYMAEKDMLELAAKFSPYRYVSIPGLLHWDIVNGLTIGVSLCGICGGLRMLTSPSWVVDKTSRCDGRIRCV